MPLVYHYTSHLHITLSPWKRANMRTTLRDGSLESRVLNDMRTRSDVEKGNDSQSDVTSDKSYSSAATTAKREWIRISPDSPRNWPTWRKWWLIVGLQFYCTIIFIAADGFITDQAQVQYGVGEQVSILGQSMYILGIAVGVSRSLQPLYEKPIAAAYINITCSQCSWQHCPRSMVDSLSIPQASSSSPFCRFRPRSRQLSPAL